MSQIFIRDWFPSVELSFKATWTKLQIHINTYAKHTVVLSAILSIQYSGSQISRLIHIMPLHLENGSLKGSQYSRIWKNIS